MNIFEEDEDMAWPPQNPTSRRVSKPPRRLSLPIALSVVAIVAIVAVVTFMAMRPTADDEIPDEDVPRAKPRRVVERKPSEPRKTAPTPKAAPKPKKKRVRNEIPPKPSFMDQKPRSEWDSRETAIAYQWYAKNPSNRIEGIDMRTRVPPPVFSNMVQEAILPYLEIGADVLPVGRVTDEEAWEAVNTPIVFNPEDPEELLTKKQGVKEMLGELKEYMERGGHAQDYFLKLESRQALEMDAMTEVRKQVRQLESTGDTEGAKEALDVYNKYLESKGLPKIRMRIRKLNVQQEN